MKKPNNNWVVNPKIPFAFSITSNIKVLVIVWQNVKMKVIAPMNKKTITMTIKEEKATT